VLFENTSDEIARSASVLSARINDLSQKWKRKSHGEGFGQDTFAVFFVIEFIRCSPVTLVDVFRRGD
jgi:hypothetical protein